MKWKCESQMDYKIRLFKWHKYFAWFPVWCWSTKTTVWFEFVERRADHYSNYFDDFNFEYREII